jgi:DNA-binding winged helix-turn-helix (wHTH) protein
MFITIERSSAPESPFAARASGQRAAAWAHRTGEGQTYRFGRCEVRPACREVLVDGVKRNLQRRPFDLLVYLIEHRSRVLSIDELLDVIWSGQEVQICSLAAAVARIRSVLDDGMDGADAAIKTFHRVGYRFVAPLQADAAAAR